MNLLFVVPNTLLETLIATRKIYGKVLDKPKALKSPYGSS